MRTYIRYNTQTLAPVSRHGDWCVILTLEIIQKRVAKIIKRVKDYS